MSSGPAPEGSGFLRALQVDAELEHGEETMADMTLDNFELLDNQQENLGKGSFGVVQKIRRKGTDKVYALKSMRKSEVIDGQLVDQVEIEIQVQLRMKHENVVRLYRHFEDNETVYLLLEYCAKGELYQILRTQKYRRFTEREACRFFSQVAQGLHHLHSNGIMHRDIKPENLLVNHNNVLKIADFGWCAQCGDKLSTTFCGTLDYLAPEMIQGRGHNHTLDIWSAGVLLYEMVVGRPPFQSTNHTELITRILHLQLNFPSFVSSHVQDLVRRLLKMQPMDRLPLNAALTHEWVTTSSNVPVEGQRPVPCSSPAASVPCSPQMVQRARSTGTDDPKPKRPQEVILAAGNPTLRVGSSMAAPSYPAKVPQARSLRSPSSAHRNVPAATTPPVLLGGHNVAVTAELPTTPTMATRQVEASVSNVTDILSRSRPADPVTPSTQSRIVEVSATATAADVARRRLGPAQASTPSTVVYRPIVSSPAAQNRNVPAIGSVTADSIKQGRRPEFAAPATPLQRQPYRGVSQSPHTYNRTLGDGLLVEEAVRRGLTRQAGVREPTSLQHVSSKNALNSGTNGSTATERSKLACPASPLMNKRRHSAAKPPLRSGAPGAVAGILASPCQAFRQLPGDGPVSTGGYPTRIRSTGESAGDVQGRAQGHVRSLNAPSMQPTTYPRPGAGSPSSLWSGPGSPGMGARASPVAGYRTLPMR